MIQVWARSEFSRIASYGSIVGMALSMRSGVMRLSCSPRHLSSEQHVQPLIADRALRNRGKRCIALVHPLSFQRDGHWHAVYRKIQTSQ